MPGASAVRCTRCPLSESRSLIVDGVGSQHSKLMVVGEAPGREEDEGGSPFIGASGRILRAALVQANSRAAYFLTNSVRCRPPENRDPTHDELAACQVWLEQEIQRVRPVVILSAGRVADGQIHNALRSLEAKYPEENYEIIQVRYAKHPAYYLRKQSERPIFEREVEDAVRAAYGYDPIERGGVIPDPYFILPEDEAYKVLWPPSPWLAVDTETDDLEESISGEMVGWSLSDGYRAAFTRDAPADYLDGVPHVYFANAKYDADALGIDLWDMRRWDDVQLVAYLLRYSRVGLKELGPALTGIQMSRIQTLIGSGKSRRPFSHALRDDYGRAYDYASRDALVTARIAQVLWPRLEADKKLEKRYHELEKPLVPVIHDMELRGVQIDTDALDAAGVVVAEAIREREEPLRSRLGIDNLQSNHQMAAGLIGLGFDLTVMTESGESYSVAEQVIIEASGAYSEASLDPEKPKQALVKEILEYRQYKKLESTYIKGLRKWLWADGSLHGKFNQVVTDTGRLSSSEPNLQNIPERDPGVSKAIRKCFKARPAYRLVVMDYSQLQLRIFADYTRDPVFLSAYPFNGEEKDVHQQTADQFPEYYSEEDYATKAARKRCKNVNFSVLFGAAENKIAQTAGVPKEKGGSFLRDMRERVPGLLLWQPHVANLLAQNGYLETRLGFRGYFPGFWSPISRDRAEALRQASCFPIQGTEADIVKLLMLDSVPVFREHRAHLVLQVHDELVAEVPVENVESFSKAMVKQGAETGYKVIQSVPLRLSVTVADTWGEAK